MTVPQALNSKRDVPRIYLSRKEVRRRLTNVEDIERYELTSEKGLLITATKVDGNYEQPLEMIQSVREFRKGEEMRVVC